MHFDYELEELLSRGGGPEYEHFQSIKDVHDYAIKLFLNIDESLNLVISFREFSGIGIVVQFDLQITNSKIHTSIMYTPYGEKLGNIINLEGNWYVYMYDIP